MAQTAAVRPPHWAGSFYPADSKVLGKTVDDMLAHATAPPVPGHVRAVIAPHAGYVYSGPVAAAGYAQLMGRDYEVVVVVAPSHKFFQGVSVFPGAAYATPLGEIAIAADLAQAIADADDCITRTSRGHEREHSLEVQLPFLQRALGAFQLVPVVIGDQSEANCRALARVLSEYATGPATLLVGSSDLSHFHSYDEAVELDGVAADDIARCDPERFIADIRKARCEACGAGAVTATLLAARAAGARAARVLMRRNSGDVTGDRSEVVGYLSAVVYEASAAEDA